MSGLFFPRPSASGSSASSLPLLLPSTSPYPSARQPPSNFHSHNSSGTPRLPHRPREPKSPFVPKKLTGKQRDISSCTVEELTGMLEGNIKLLSSSPLTSSLPGGMERIQERQEMIRERLGQLGVREVREGLERVGLEEGMKVDSIEVGSPRTKVMILQRAEVGAPNSLTATMSLGESIALQQKAVTRAREEAQRRAEKVEVDAARSTSVGGLLRGALGDASSISNFMFHVDSDEEEEEEGEEFAVSGHLDEDEEAELNPYRAAFEAGYAQAEDERELPTG